MVETVFVRLRFVLIGLAILAGLILIQLLRIEFDRNTSTRLKELEHTLSRYEKEFSPERGRIFDAKGELLATNDVEYEVGLSPAYIVTPEDVATQLSSILDKSVTEILDATKSKNPYVLIKRPVSAEVGEKIKALQAAFADDHTQPDLRGVDLAPIQHRFYPNGALASPALGFVAYNKEGKQVGYYGVEGFYNDLLSGRPVKGFEEVVPLRAQPNPVPDQGADLYLTLDRDVQYLVEKTLTDAMNKYGAEGGSILVTEPKTGAILGMASWPTFDPNNYVESPPPDPANPVVSGQYEPGSTFKILTMAAALDAGLVKPDTGFLDTGYIEVGGLGIYNWNRGAWGPVDMIGCMRHSLNVCMAHLSTQMGAATFYNYLSAFGIGRATNVDLAAEISGHLKQPGNADWYDSDLGTNSFGQGVAVTPLQLVTAAGALANGGVMMQPHILYRVEHGTNARVIPPQIIGRPVKPESAAMLTEMLAVSMETGEADMAVVPGYRLAGKTGTAEIPMAGGYEENRSIASFIGWGPVDDPRFVTLIVLNRPTASIWGSETAAPVFSEMVKRLVVLLEIPPDDVRHAIKQGQ
jgi:cell division protein FtsI/penicillin-binding protein 2